MTARIAPREADAMLHARGEVALLDVREAAAHGEGHPLFAAPCPYSALETTADTLLPRRAVPVILLDDGDGVAGRAAARLARLGFSDIRVLDGGAPGWRAAGLNLFAGVNVPSKTLGELVEESLHPATVDAASLARWRAEGRSFRLFDVRPAAEFERMTVPGAESMPNGELAHRLGAVVGDEAVPIVLTCAGRTRGLVGAAGLKLLGVPNPVYALEDGTQGWALAGFALDRGRRAAPPPALTPAARAASAARARALAAAEGIAMVDGAEATRLARDPDRTTHVFDLRADAERAADPVPGALPASTVQIVQATDHAVAVRGARIVLVDDTGLRATLAAAFLARMGFEVAALALDAGGPHPSFPARTPFRPADPPALPAAEAVRRAAAPGVALIDLRPSAAHAAARPAGAAWSIRPRLPADLPAGAREVILVADEGPAAALAAVDLAEAGVGVAVVEGGMDGWRQAGGAVDEAPLPQGMAGAPDVVWFTRGRHDGDREASLRYLAWERGLVAALSPAERRAFRL